MSEYNPELADFGRSFTWKEDEIKATVPRCLNIMQIERKGVRARDIDDLLSAHRKFILGKSISTNLRERLSVVIPKVLQFDRLNRDGNPI